MKYRNVRVFNIEGAMRYAGAETDSKYGICSINDIPKIIRERLGPTATQDDITADYINVIQWNDGNDMVEYAALGLNDLEICDDNESKHFLTQIVVSFDAWDAGNKIWLPYISDYFLLRNQYKEASTDYKNFIEQLPYAHEWLTK